MSLLIVLPLPAKVLQPNCTIATMGGRFKKAKAIKRYRIITFNAILDEQVEDMPWGRVTVTAEFFHSTKRRRDQDNAMGSLKAAYDGIVDSGLVTDDDYEHMGRGVPTFSHDKLYPRVELTITKEEK